VHPKRRYRVRTWNNVTDTLAASEWLESTAPQPGSWWPVWQQWLVAHSSDRVAARQPGAPAAGYPALGDAPGSYVLQR
jgi:polyhydroxyalkanoate synthase